MTGQLITTWSQDSGPEGAQVTLDDPNAVDTNATFTIAGTYVLRLTADDGELSATDVVTITVNSPAPPSPGELLIGNLTVVSGKAYQVVDGGLNSGAMVDIDRSYTFTAIPASLVGTTYIQTANNDKKGSQEEFLSFSVNQDVTVYVAYDERVTSLPDWLASWANTGETLDTTDVSLHLYAKDFQAGTVILGGNLAAGAAGAKSNYSVVVRQILPAP